MKYEEMNNLDELIDRISKTIKTLEDALDEEDEQEGRKMKNDENEQQLNEGISRWEELVRGLITRSDSSKVKFRRDYAAEQKYKPLLFDTELSNRDLSGELGLSDDGRIISTTVLFPIRVQAHSSCLMALYVADYNFSCSEKSREYMGRLGFDTEKGKVFLQYDIPYNRSTTNAEMIWSNIGTLLEEAFDIYGTLHSYSVGKLPKKEKEWFATLIKDSLSVLEEEDSDSATYGLGSYKSYLEYSDCNLDAEEEDSPELEELPVNMRSEEWSHESLSQILEMDNGEENKTNLLNRRPFPTFEEFCEMMKQHEKEENSDDE